MADLKAQEIFAAGTWNGMTFTDADLDGMVAAFNGLGLAGKVPLKFGHDSAKPVKDGKPALGWVQRLYREGRRLMADFSNVPDAVMTAIREKLYKHVSVELLQNVKAGTREIPWVPDAVALLGADQPAVGILKELEALTMSARTVLRFDARVAFTRDFHSPTGDQEHMSEESLRAENARLNQQLAESVIENAINAGDCLPAIRVSFAKNHRPELRTVENAKEWVRLNRSSESQRRRTLQTRGSSAFDSDGDTGEQTNSMKFSSLVSRVAKEMNFSAADLQDANKHAAVLHAVQARDPSLWHAHAVAPWD
jgi:DNA-binding transcriptional regulator YhcF (GntR family)